MLLFFVTPCLVVAVQSCMKWIAIFFKKDTNALLAYFHFSIIFENFSFSLWWSLLKSTFCETNFSVVSGTMVFLLVVWMVFRINSVLTNSLIYWNQNNITRSKRWHEVLYPVSHRFHLKWEPCFELRTLEFKWYFLYSFI